MATRKSTYGAKNPQIQHTGKRCRDCAHSYDWQNRSFDDGHLILCRCPFQKEGGKYCIFLSDLACEYFEQRKEGGDE